MLVNISIPPAILELYHLLLRFWKLHGSVTLIAFGAGALLVFLLFSLLGFRRFRVIRRVINTAEDADLAEFDYETIFNRVRVRRSERDATKRHVRNLQAPAVRSTQPGSATTLQQFGNDVVYYFPESPETPEGLILPQRVTWVFGNPPDIQLELKVTPVLVDAPGSWYPAIVKKSTGLTSPRHQARRSYWKHGYCNLFVGHFVLVGDVLGAITVPGLINRRVIVRAPCNGFILQFGALPFTPVVPGASVMLIGALPEVKTLTYSGNLAGYFHFAPDEVESYVGSTVENDAHIADVSVLYGTFQQPIHAPRRMRIVRQFVKNGDGVQYDQPLFAYIPIV